MEEKITQVSPYGFKIEGSDEWLNALDNVQPYLKSVQAGDKVEYSLDDDGKVRFIKVLEMSQGQAVSKTVEEYVNKPKEFHLTSEAIRIGALTSALKYYDVNGVKPTSKDALMQLALVFESWIKGETVAE